MIDWFSFFYRADDLCCCIWCGVEWLSRAQPIDGEWNISQAFVYVYYWHSMRSWYVKRMGCDNPSDFDELNPISNHIGTIH